MANNIEIKAQDPVGSRSASPSTQFPEHQHQQNDPILQELGELRIRCLQTENELARATEALQTTQQHSRGQFYEISSLKAKISHLQNIIEKQKMTIARQSKIIAQRPQNVLPSNNSNRNRNGNGNSMVLWTRPPAPMPQTHQQNTLSPLTANHHAGPFASSQSSVPNQDLVRYRYAGHFASRPQVSRPQNGYGMTSNTVVDAFEHKVAYFSSQFHGLWDMTDAFGRNFTARVDEPNGLNIGYVLSFLPDHKMLAAPSNDPTIRCLLVITAINRYIIQDIVKFYNVVRGVDHAVDKELLSLKKNLHAGKYLYSNRNNLLLKKGADVLE
ncbi:hypothetical protein VTN31DRAFT_1031 [Thermomyces dupontii]|uniref:uncharacterized protein n=1 Tax=Talaromyces thermophilus TaxID=28565 RepID=UPI0037420DF7